jgi:hypothetical protein
MMICQSLIPLPSSLCNVIYIQKDIVRGNAYMENQQTYSRDDIYIYQYLSLPTMFYFEMLPTKYANY